jgi:PAS domain-containing protein
LGDCAILHTAPEADFDRVACLAGRLCDTPIARVCFVDEDHEWCKARVGDDVEETLSEWAFCRQVVASGLRLVVPDVLTDPRFADNPLGVTDPRVRSFAGVPLALDDGYVVGTLCVVDERTHAFDDTQLEDLATMATQITTQLELRRSAGRLDREHCQLTQARAEIQDGERYLQAVVDSSRDVICRLTPEGVVEMVSESIRQVLGVDPHAVVGRSAFDLIHRDDVVTALDDLAGTAASLGAGFGSSTRQAAGCQSNSWPTRSRSTTDNDASCSSPEISLRRPIAPRRHRFTPSSSDAIASLSVIGT